MAIVLYVILGVVVFFGIIIIWILLGLRKKVNSIRADINFLERGDSEDNWNNLFTTLENYQNVSLSQIKNLEEGIIQLDENVLELGGKINKIEEVIDEKVEDGEI